MQLDKIDRMSQNGQNRFLMSPPELGAGGEFLFSVGERRFKIGNVIGRGIGLAVGDAGGCRGDCGVQCSGT